MEYRFIISEEDADTRLDVFLSSKIPTMTRSAIAKLLKAGAGTVGGKAASVHRFLKAGDEVVLDSSKAGSSHAQVRPAAGAVGSRLYRHATTPDTAPTLNVIKETDAWIVIDKPTGLLVHPDAATTSGTLADALVAHDPAIAKIGEDPSRPGIVHRLDREVSGLMVVAKTQDAFDGLKRQFAEHSVDKRYLALVHGDVRKDEGDIKFRIARSKTQARMAARPESEEEGKAAWTHYKVLRRFHGATLLELAILSGRTHQIRAHMLALGHPVMGDPLYNTRKATRKRIARSKDEGNRTDVPRLLLQAVHLSFVDPATGETQAFDIPADPAFDAAIKELSSADARRSQP